MLCRRAKCIIPHKYTQTSPAPDARASAAVVFLLSLIIPVTSAPNTSPATKPKVGSSTLPMPPPDVNTGNPAIPSSIYTRGGIQPLLPSRSADVLVNKNCMVIGIGSGIVINLPSTVNEQSSA